MNGENRSTKRNRKRLPLRFGVQEASRIGFTDDLSETGLFIKSAIVQNPNSILKIELTLPGGEVVVLTGRVMWAKRVPPNLLRRLKGGMGIRILDFQSGETAYLRLCADLTAALVR